MWVWIGLGLYLTVGVFAGRKVAHWTIEDMPSQPGGALFFGVFATLVWPLIVPIVYSMTYEHHPLTVNNPIPRVFRWWYLSEKSEPAEKSPRHLHRYSPWLPIADNVWQKFCTRHGCGKLKSIVRETT